MVLILRVRPQGRSKVDRHSLCRDPEFKLRVEAHEVDCNRLNGLPDFG